MRWEPILQLWVLDLTGPNGHIPKPACHIKYGSVLPGEWIGEEKETRWIYRRAGGKTWDDWTELADRKMPVKILRSIYIGNDKWIEETGIDHRLKGPIY